MGGISLKPRYVGTGTFKTTELMWTLVDEVLRSGRISYGEKSRQFEQEFAALHHSNFAILSNSGTSSLHVALHALKELHRWETGNVIVPATTFVATANIVHHCGLVPVFVDVEPDTYNMDMDEVEKVVNKDTVAAIPVHLLGQPANMRRLHEVLPLDVKIIEDSCESMFATHNHRKVGGIGNIGCFSTYAAHIIVTGVGGIATTSNPDYAAKMRSLVNHGLTIENLNPNDNFSPRPMLNRRFMFDTYGYSYRITELEAALGLAQLATYEQMLAIRRRNARHLQAGITRINRDYDNPISTYVVRPENESCFMMFPIVLNKQDGKSVDKTPLMQWLNARQIETRDLLPILCQPIYSWLDPKRYPVSNWLVDSGFYVGCHQDLEPSDIDYVLQEIESYFHNLRHHPSKINRDFQ